tara:strand:- start:2117 stop:2323 length:207 start_codon:yes stop_codon:yes gene_type:complete
MLLIREFEVSIFEETSFSEPIIVPINVPTIHKENVLNKPNKIEDRNAIKTVNLYGTANFKILKNIFIN